MQAKIKNFKLIRLPKGAPQGVRDQFVRSIAESRSITPLDKAIASINLQIDKRQPVMCPLDLCPAVAELIEPYVMVHRRPRKRKPPQA